MRNILSAVLIMIAGWATAQSYPEPSDLAVNDFAGIIDDATEARLSDTLDTLRQDTGVEMVVLTLSRQEMFAPDISLKKFARGIFDEWGIGDKTRDDGVLVLVLRGDQAIRIALGKGFGGKAEDASDKAVERSFLPAFREDRYAEGIETGVADLIANLVSPHVAKLGLEADGSVAGTDDTSASTTAAEDATAAKDDVKDGGEGGGEGGASASWLLYVLGGFGALIAFFVVKAKNRKCPECSAKGLKTTSSTVRDATEDSTGEGERITSCAKCGYRTVETYEIAKRSKPEPEPEKPKEEFSGGKAGKDGSTGKW